MGILARSGILIALTAMLHACTGPTGNVSSDAGRDVTTDTGHDGTTDMTHDASPTCIPRATSETACVDGLDDDCDGYIDCLDPDCEGHSCGAGTLACTAGACLQPGPLQALPRIENVRVTMRRDTAVIDFEPVANARDYRVYINPNPADVLVGSNGQLVVRNAIYRCAGDLQRQSRDTGDLSNVFSASLTGRIEGYMRTEAEAQLGYVYLAPGEGRQPVYRVSDPNLSACAWASTAPYASECNAADYVVGTAAHDQLVARGWRDDGIVFYAPDAGTRAVYYRRYRASGSQPTVVIFYADGPEATAHASEDMAGIEESGVRFHVLTDPLDGAVPLHRVFYAFGAAHDVIAAGEARYQRALHLGNQPVWSLVWPGLTQRTTLVVEALDNGCPFPGGYVNAVHADAVPSLTQSCMLQPCPNPPTITLDEARLPSTGEVFLNGQHDPTNRPQPIARAYVDVAPEPTPQMDWYEGFDPGATWAPLPLILSTGNNTLIYRNDRLSIEFDRAATPNHGFAPLLGQFVIDNASDGGNIYVIPRGVAPRMSSDHFVHVRMASDIPGTTRRYPQIVITTVQMADPGPSIAGDSVPIGSRLGPLAFDMLPPGNDQTIVVQPFSEEHELQIEFCDQRGWGVGNQCPRANLYGFHAGDESPTWTRPWLPVPVIADVAGADRVVQFDVYASTDRVYVFVDGQPGGCAVLPAGRMPAAPVSVLYGLVGYHLDADDPIVSAHAYFDYWNHYGQEHIGRRFDDLGIELSVPAPAWDETRMPCGTEWYGGR